MAENGGHEDMGKIGCQPQFIDGTLSEGGF